MKISKRALLSAAGAGLTATVAKGVSASDVTTPSLSKPLAGSFTADWDSLDAGYRAPDWFRDAKFGLWAHWGAQCVPEEGDWYGRNMYIQGHRQYQHHLTTYGHPADTGFIDIYPKWTAENWQPDELLDLYAGAGARYFVAMANHHDNFDAYDSKFHDWNSVRIGAKRDIIGDWAKATRKRGLKFGVSNHAARAWHWLQIAYAYDSEGPRAGDRYDAFRLSKLDGKGKWWEGLDPQELYAGAVFVMPDGMKTRADADAWRKSYEAQWNDRPPLTNPAFVRQWYLRTKDLIDSYRPDLVYFDNGSLPLGQAGLDIAAHYYNSSMAWHGGKLEAVLNIKGNRKAYVPDIERGFRAEISEQPWQTDTCIGSWHYQRSRFDQKTYLPAASVIHRLCDIVSKNGNLLLSIPMRGDGTIDSEERRIVEEIGDWMARFSDAIYGTRPWRVFGEGPTQAATGNFGEKNQKPYTADDVRFTTKRGAVYAMTLGKPEAPTVVLASLAKGGAHAMGSISRIDVVGSDQHLTFHQDAVGLHITVPETTHHPFGIALKISGTGLV